jgi:hypothetical protein
MPGRVGDEVRRVDPSRDYTLYEIADADLLESGVKTFGARKNHARNAILTDKATVNVLDAVIYHDPANPSARWYSVRGENIIRYLANRDANRS